MQLFHEELRAKAFATQKFTLTETDVQPLAQGSEDYTLTIRFLDKNGNDFVLTCSNHFLSRF